ncbi:MAG TPA: hypothetical protein VHU85_02500 [Acidimicrobiales bacterium]|jgi:ribosomal-protein-alanine N-acetyltransferase|nr:hypothetical protein [Acidimicrobiales bacterium]
MDIALSSPSDADADEFLAAVAASRAFHRPWIEPPDTPDRFADYLERAAGVDRASFLVRDAEVGTLVG